MMRTGASDERSAGDQRALVTGATGFIGSRLVRRLLEESWVVHVIVRPTSALEGPHTRHERITAHVHDGTTEHLHNVLTTVRPTIVFHLASLFLAEHKASEVEALIRSNVLFATQLLDAMAASDVRRLVNTGTAWQHFHSDEYSPVCLYAATKQAFEAILNYYVAASSLQAITLKLFDTYGPDDPRPKLLSLLRNVAESSQPLGMSAGEQGIDLVHIDDVITAFTLAAERLGADKVSGHEIYAVSSGRPISLRELVELYGRVAGKELLIRWGDREYRPREVMVPWRGGALLPGWEPSVSLEEGLRGMVTAGRQVPERDLRTRSQASR